MPARDTAQKWVLSEEPEPELTEPVIDEGGNGTVLVDAINRALDEELSHNPKMLVFGEDVAGGKGGVFTATRCCEYATLTASNIFSKHEHFRVV